MNWKKIRKIFLDVLAYISLFFAGNIGSQMQVAVSKNLLAMDFFIDWIIISIMLFIFIVYRIFHESGY